MLLISTITYRVSLDLAKNKSFYIILNFQYNYFLFVWAQINIHLIILLLESN